MKITFLSTGYDKTAKFEEIKPLLNQVHDFLKANEIPFLFSASVKVDVEGNNHDTITSAYFNGAETTPPEFAVANTAITEDIPKAIALAMQIMASGYTGAVRGAEDAADFTEGPKPTVSGAGHA